MADYYTQFSCTLDVGTAENAQKALEIYKAPTDLLEDDENFCYGFALSILPNSPTVLHIHDDELGNTDYVFTYVGLLAKTLGLKGKWGFSYANTCSKARVDAFGGGAYVMDLETGEEIAVVDTNTWLDTKLQP